jgi:hypothetical protein
MAENGRRKSFSTGTNCRSQCADDHVKKDVSKQKKPDLHASRAERCHQCNEYESGLARSDPVMDSVFTSVSQPTQEWLCCLPLLSPLCFSERSCPIYR